MPRVLLTAFAPYDDWRENASWLALQAVTRELHADIGVTTRRYPVDYDGLRNRLVADLASPPDVVLCLGQAPAAAAVRLELFGVNARRGAGEPSDAVRPLEAAGPAAYRSRLPLGNWTRTLREAGVPTELSLSAGDYLCNAAMYWSHHLLAEQGADPAVAFVHLPLDVSQAAALPGETPSLPTEYSAYAVRRLLELANEWSLAHSASGQPAAAPQPIETTL
ncbi:MAG: pyroglutamyl-peptidase I [Planctomycetota bacterium]